MKIYIVQGEHWSVPATPMSAHTTMGDANKEAVRFVNVLIDDTDAIDKPEPVTVDNWQDAVDWLQDYHGAQHCDVWITELELKGFTPPTATVYLDGGMIQDVETAGGTVVTIHDYDVDGTQDDDLPRNSAGDRYILSTYGEPTP